MVIHVGYVHTEMNFPLVTIDDLKYKFEIKEAVFKVCFVKMYPSFIFSHSRILPDHPVVYPIQRSEIKCFSISQGQYNFSAGNVFNAVPNILHVGLVSSEAFNGSYIKNPFNFQHYDCNFAAFYVDRYRYPKNLFIPISKVVLI